MSERIEQTLALVNECLEAWKHAMAHLETIEIELMVLHPAIGSPINELDIALTSSLEIATLLNPGTVATQSMMVTTSDFQLMTDDLTEIINVSIGINNFFDEASANNRVIQVTDVNLLTDSGGPQLNLGKQLNLVKQKTGNLIHRIALLREFITSQKIEDLTEATRQFHDLANEIKSILSSVGKADEEANAATAEISSLKESAGKLLAQVEEANKTANDSNEQAQAAINETEAKLEKVREVSNQAETLRVQVEQYQAQYDAFQLAMEERERAFDQFTNSNQEAQKMNKERELRIDEVINKSNQMLVGATNVGLSTAFNLASDKYEEEASKAKREFFGAIFLLVAFAVPLAWYLWTSNNGGNGITLSGTTARAALLFPAILLTTFTSHRFWAFFQLHREYAFKAAIAMSIDGFKQQAPKYEEEITGAAFLELVEKPDHSTPKEAMKSPNPILDVLFSNIKHFGHK